MFKPHGLLARTLGVVKLLGWLILYMVAITIVQVYLLHPNGDHPLVLLGFLLLLIGVTAFFYWRFKKSYPTQAQRLRLSDIISDIGIFIALLVVKGIFGMLIEWLYSENTTANDAAIQMLLGEEPHLAVIAVFLFMTAFTAPFVEEVIFRGYLTTYLFPKQSLILPMILSGAVFSFMHLSGNIVSFFLYMTMGMMLYLAYYRKHNIHDAIFVHLLNNLPAAIFMVMQLL